jgi:hypothetical protein
MACRVFLVNLQRLQPSPAEVAWLRALGVTDADGGQGDVPGVCLTDPEGNEFCVLTPG